MTRRFTAWLACSLLVCGPVAAVQPWFPIGAEVRYRTGDSWTDGDVTYRLYGVQSCLRGTFVTNLHGLQRDCGEASLLMLAAFVRDLRPQCHEVARTPQDGTVLVFCIATPSAGAGAGSRLDLGTALIATGYAFAALTPDGAAVHPPYAAAQDVARRSMAGLWAFPDLPEPNSIIRRTLAAQAGAPAAQSEPRQAP